MSMERKQLLLLIMVVFAALYYVARIGIFYAGQTGSMDFEEEQSAFVENIVVYSFLAIGILGFVFLPGVYLQRQWGLWGTLAVSGCTIAFDIWAAVAVQSSAAAGIVPAAAIAGYLLLVRKNYIGER